MDKASALALRSEFIIPTKADIASTRLGDQGLQFSSLLSRGKGPYWWADS
jgi:hypothetical protein